MISGVIYSLLSPLVAGGRCTPSRFPQEEIGAPGTTPPSLSAPSWPAIRYTIISAVNEPTICGTDNVDTDDTRVQIDVVALTYGGMVTLRDSVINAFMGTTPPCIRNHYFETWDAETKTHRGVLDFTFYASSGSGSP